jgi:hypothetical protein
LVGSKYDNAGPTRSGKVVEKRVGLDGEKKGEIAGNQVSGREGEGGKKFQEKKAERERESVPQGEKKRDRKREGGRVLGTPTKALLFLLRT